MKPIFENRDFTPRQQPVIDWRVDSMEWDIRGCPRMASMTPFGGDQDIWYLADMLRAPVRIYDDLGRNPWWGFVSEVHLSVRGGILGVGYSLDTMANNVACTYSFIEPGGTIIGERRTTAYSSYAYGTATYGQKDYIVSVDGMTGASGTLVRDAYLTRHQIPQGIAEVGVASASVICRGWWDTMTWRNASNSGTGGTAITSHLSSLVTSYGQFLTGAILETTNSGTIAPYWSGDYTAYDEAEKLMAMGGANGRRINVTVDNERRAIFSQEPDAPSGGTAAFYMDRMGNLYDMSQSKLEPHIGYYAVGNYVLLRDVVLFNNTALLSDPSLQFLEGLVWQAGALRPEFRGDINARDIVKAKE